MEILLIKFFIAHVLGDFFFQSDNWVKEKEEKKLKSPKLYLHVLIHGLLTLILLADIKLFPYAILLMFLHGIIDGFKIVFQKPENKRTWFFVDQLLHFIAIISVWFLLENPQLNFSFLHDSKFWTYLLSILILTFPCSVIIKVLIAKWTPKTVNRVAETSLQSAGKYIGIMERLLVFTFICTNHFEAIGFLIAAKSIFRFGDLKEGSDLKLTEYILIGTLLSFGLALVISLITSQLLV
jgi:hypothetical protein